MAATLTGDQELVYASFPIVKTEEDADGNLIVWGKATDGTVDSDRQIVDVEWSGKALREWLDTGGNVRVQHNPMRDPAGKGLQVEVGTDGHWVKSLIVEPVAQRLVKSGVLRAYSVGIARPKIEPDPTGKAIGGIIRGGPDTSIVELSLVDRPANKNCGFQLVAKSASGGPEWVGKMWGDQDSISKLTPGTPSTANADPGDMPEYEMDQEPGTEPTEDSITPLDGMGEGQKVRYKSVSLELPDDVSVAFSPADLAKLHTFAQELGAELAEFQKSADVEEAFLGKKHRKFSARRRKQLAGSGNALADGCVSAETLVATRNGPQRIDALVGKCELLTDAGWAAAEVRSFGVRNLFAVNLRYGGEQRTVYATAGHRWLTADDRWVLTDSLRIGDRIPQVDVPAEFLQADGLNVSKCGIAPDAEKSAEAASHMVMINLECGPGTACASVSTGDLGHVPADGTAAFLLREGSFVDSISNSILTEECSVAPGHPSFVSELHALGAEAGSFLHAEPAVRTAALPSDVEVGVRQLSTTHSADNRSFVLDGHSVSLADTRTGATVGLAEIEPSIVAGVAPSVHGAGTLRGLAAVDAGFDSHSDKHTLYPSWEVTGVYPTERREEVFCAVVPDLHRFVLADGILTGNSYPIPDADALRRAAILARSGHGNVAAARRLIARRAKELGVANPLKESDAVKKSDDVQEEAAKGATATCDVCKGPMTDGKCMKCMGKSAEEPDAEKGINQMNADDNDTDSDADEDDKGADKSAQASCGCGPDCGCRKAEKAKSKSKSKPKGGKPPWLKDDDKDDDDSAEGSDNSNKAGKPTPADGVTGMTAQPVPVHREPDGADIESFEGDAGMPTVPDSSVSGVGKSNEAADSPEMQAALRLKSAGVAHQLGVLHDLCCPVYAPGDLAKFHPGASFSGLDLMFFAQKAMDAAAGAASDGTLAEAAKASAMWTHAQTLKSLTVPMMLELQAEAHKAFRDANPGVSSFPTPGHISPQQYQRGPITAGHAAESPGAEGPHSATVPSGQISAESYTRGPITAGHAADSPANKSTGVPMRVDYVPTIRENGAAAMRAMHDHVAQTFPDVCALAPGEPGGIMSRPVPVPQGTPPARAAKLESEGDALSKGAAAPDVTAVAAPGKVKAAKKLRKKLGKKVLSGKMTVDEARAKIGRRVAQKAGGQSMLGVTGGGAAAGGGMKAADAELVKAAVAEPPVSKASDPDVFKSAVVAAVEPLLERLAASEAALKRQSELLDQLAGMPDPNVSAFRGMAFKSAGSTARPGGVQTVAEIADRTQAAMFRELEVQWRTDPNPAQREAAWKTLQKMRGMSQ